MTQPNPRPQPDATTYYRDLRTGRVYADLLPPKPELRARFEVITAEEYIRARKEQAYDIKQY